jgi:AcrR family transcriptional regulator
VASGPVADEGRRAGGRPRSARSRAAILAAAGDLMMEGGLASATVEAIASRAGVGKATIYKWWPSRAAVALEGFMQRAAELGSFPESTTAIESIRAQMLGVLELFTESPAGPLMRSLAADAQFQPEIAAALRDQWLAPRRAISAEILGRGIARGELRADLEIPVVVDLIYGPLYYRLLFGHESLDVAAVDALLDLVRHAIVAPGNP